LLRLAEWANTRFHYTTRNAQAISQKEHRHPPRAKTLAFAPTEEQIKRVHLRLNFANIFANICSGKIFAFPNYYQIILGQIFAKIFAFVRNQIFF
jgi:hypothetical protein